MAEEAPCGQEAQCHVSWLIHQVVRSRHDFHSPHGLEQQEKVVEQLRAHCECLVLERLRLRQAMNWKTCQVEVVVEAK